MRFFLVAFLGAILVFISVQAYRLAGQRAQLETSLEAHVSESLKLSQENEQYKRAIEFNKDDENLIKEAQTKYNVHKPGEVMLILIPPENATSE